MNNKGLADHGGSFIGETEAFSDKIDSRLSVVISYQLGKIAGVMRGFPKFPMWLLKRIKVIAGIFTVIAAIPIFVNVKGMNGVRLKAKDRSCDLYIVTLLPKINLSADTRIAKRLKFHDCEAVRPVASNQ